VGVEVSTVIDTGADESERLEAFLAVVECDPAKVLDVPADRLGVAADDIPAGAEVEAAARFEVYFGKHRGRTMAEVPEDYLRWSLVVRHPSGQLRKFARMAGLELERRRNLLNEKVGDSEV